MSRRQTITVDVDMQDISDHALLEEIADRFGDDAVRRLYRTMAAKRDGKTLKPSDENRLAREAAEEEIAELRSLLFRRDIVGALSRLEHLLPCEGEMANGIFKILERGKA